MITQFKIFENVNPPKSEVRKLVNNSEFTQNYSEDYGAIYTYRNVTFGWWGNAFRLSIATSIIDETEDMSHYIDDYINNGDVHVRDDEGYSAPEHSIGKTIDELKSFIDDYYIYKEGEKYNL